MTDMTSANNSYQVFTGGAFTSIPALSINVKKSADDLAGTYKLEYPNPKGYSKTEFNHFQEQEIKLAYPATGQLFTVFKGQINNIDLTSQKQKITLNGRGLSGLLTDRKVNDDWESMRVDFIVCDPTYGAIPIELETTLTTWNDFTDDYDTFPSWSEDRWGVEPAYCAIVSNKLEITSTTGAVRTLMSVSEFNYETGRFNCKLSSKADYLRVGFCNGDGSKYVSIKMMNTVGYSECKDSGITTNTLDGSYTLTDYHYYRVEWDNAEARFFIDGVLLDTITTNVPSDNLYMFMEIGHASDTSHYHARIEGV